MAGVMALSGAGCGPSVPEAAEARSWFEADEAKIREFDRDVRRYVGVESLVTPIADDNPNFLELGARRERARAGFRETALPEMTRSLGALGAQVRLLGDGDDSGILGGAGTPTPGMKDGSVAAEAGEEIDGRKLGWGVYTVDGEDGGSREVRGYEVYWEAAVEERPIGFRVYMPGR